MIVGKNGHSLTFYPKLEEIFEPVGRYQKNTYADFFLIPAVRPVIQPPPQKESIIDVPGSYGSIDASNSLTGYPVYGLREGQLSFYAENDRHTPATIYSNESWASLYSRIQSYLHGKTFYLVLEDDRAFYYHGRFTVDEWGSGQNFSGVTISYHLYPFKKELSASDEDWIWDSFNFETGIIRDYRNIQITAGSTTTLRIPVRDEYIVPKFNASKACKLTYKGVTYDIPAGVSENPAIVIGAESYIINQPNYYSDEGNPDRHETLEFTATSSCTITVTYRGGAL